MGLWSSGMTRHSHCRDGSSILPRSTKHKNHGRNIQKLKRKADRGRQSN